MQMVMVTNRGMGIVMCMDLGLGLVMGMAVVLMTFTEPVCGPRPQ